MTFDSSVIESLRLFAQTARIMNSTLNKGELIDIMLDEAGKLFDSSLIALVVRTDESDACNAYLALGKKRRHLFVPDSMMPETRSSDQLMVREIAPDDPWRKILSDQLGADVTSRLRVDLVNRGSLMGFLDIFDCGRAANDLEYSAEMVSAMADLLVIAWDNAEMYDAMRRKSLQNDLLLESSRLLSTSLDLDEVLGDMMIALKNVIDYDAAGIYLVKQGTSLVTPRVWQGYPEEDSRTRLGLKVGEGLIGWVIEKGEGVYVPDTDADERYVEARPETRSELVVPIMADDMIIGAFNVESDAVDAFSRDDVKFLTVFASQAAASIERARLYRETLVSRRLEEQLSIARMIQQSFLPDMNPPLKGFEIAGMNIPSQEVGGDYYDFIDIVENQTGIAIADVSGKGMPASLIMAAFRASLIAEIRNNYAIRTILQKVNRLLCESLDNGRFVTAVYGVLDSKNRVFTFSNAGHNPPLHVRADGSCEELVEGGLALGIIDGSVYEERPIYVAKGDLIAFYTDGVNEAVDSAGEQFGEQRILDLLIENRHLPAREIVQLLVDSVMAFAADDSDPDDITMIVVRAL
jgi:sigma-B regulation protein RsbU (phosphoserine phosphatase)